VDSFGGLDIIVNNAGYTWDSVIQKMSGEQWDAILDVHLKAPFRILRAAQPVISGLVKQARAGGQPVPCRKVVNISSIAGTPADAAGAVYLFRIPEPDYVSAQTLICGGGFFG
jgi:3-oxoacyl-[acyl-carrier protein] reductase